MNQILSLLTGGDRRSIGRSEEAARIVLANPGQFGELFTGLESPHPLVAMRAANGLEKVTAQRPELLQPHKTALLELADRAIQQEVRWHLAQMLPRLVLDERERLGAFQVLTGYLADKSGIVRTFTLQALVDLAQQDERLQPQAVAILQEA